MLEPIKEQEVLDLLTSYSNRLFTYTLKQQMVLMQIISINAYLTLEHFKKYCRDF